MLICELTRVENKRLICSLSDMPCAHQRYCDIKMKWIQTSAAERCRGRLEHGKRNTETDS